MLKELIVWIKQKLQDLLGEQMVVEDHMSVVLHEHTGGSNER